MIEICSIMRRIIFYTIPDRLALRNASDRIWFAIP